MLYRELTSADYIECRALYDRFVEDNDDGILPEMPPTSVLNLFYFDDEHPLYKVFGGFDEYGILCTCVFVIFSRYDRSFSIPYIMKQSFSTFDSVIENINFACEYAKERNFCKLYVRYFGNRHKVWDRILSRRSRIFNQYTSVIEEVIPARRKSSFEKYWFENQSCKIYQVPLTIKMYLLKQEFRPII